MNITDKIFLFLHVFFALFSGITYYLFVLDIVGRAKKTYKKILYKSIIACLFSGITWFIGFVLLRDYFSGARGFITDTTVSTFVLLFKQLQEILLPTLLLLSLMLFMLAYKRGNNFDNHLNDWKSAIFIGSLGFTVAGALMFLGVLVP